MIRFNEIKQDIHQINKDNGWWEADRDMGEVLGLVHSEISESLEAYRDGIMDKHLPRYNGEVVELADTVIRVLDIFHGFFPEFDLDSNLSSWDFTEGDEIYYLEIATEEELFRNTESFGSCINDLHDMVSHASYWLLRDDNEKGQKGLIAVLEKCYVLAGFNGWDIHAALLAKLEINRARGYKHGGKKC